MRIIGIDPGLAVTGYGIIEVTGDRPRHVHHGVLRTRAADGTASRLVAIRDGVLAVAREWAAEGGAVEAGFVSANARTALALGQARAAAVLGLADAGLAIAEYAPAMVKQTVAGYGLGDKTQVARMVAMQLGLAALPSPADAADALAVAITHWAHARIDPALLSPRR